MPKEEVTLDPAVVEKFSNYEKQIKQLEAEKQQLLTTVNELVIEKNALITYIRFIKASAND